MEQAQDNRGSTFWRNLIILLLCMVIIYNSYMTETTNSWLSSTVGNIYEGKWNPKSKLESEGLTRESGSFTMEIEHIYRNNFRASITLRNG